MNILIYLNGRSSLLFDRWLKKLLIIFGAVLLLGCLGIVIQAYAAFPGKNGKILFQSNPTGTTQIYTIDANGGNLSQLTSTGRNRRAAWSADGTKIAFESNRNGVTEIYVMNADGSGQTRVTNTSSLTFHGNSFPSWSPDGSKIIFVSNRGDGTQQLWVMDVSNLAACTVNNLPGNCPAQQLTTDIPSPSNATIPVFFPSPFQASEPVFSPDGKKIAFLEFSSQYYFATFVMNVDGSNLVQFTDSSISFGNPDWSPDSSQIAFNDAECGPCTSANIFISASPDLNFSTPITEAPPTQQITFGTTGNNLKPEFSPDDQQLLFSSHCADYPTCSISGRSIYTTNLAGIPVFTLVSSLAFGAYPGGWQALNYDFSGFLSPIAGPPTLNKIKAGQSIPVKFSLNGFKGMGVLAAGYPQIQPIACDSDTPLGASMPIATAGNSGLQYDPTTDMYTYVWQTDSNLPSGSCQQLIVKLAFAQFYPGFTGATYTANFIIK